MSSLLGQWLTEGGVGQLIQILATVLCYRAFPFVLYGLVSERVTLTARLGVAVSYVGVSFATWTDGQAGMTVDLLRMYAYFTAFGCLVYLAVRHARPVGAFGRLCFFGACAACSLLVPATGYLGARSATVVIGWEILFSAYSVFADCNRDGKRPPIGEVLFFVLVDPSLVYVQRGQPMAISLRAWLRGGARVLLGLAMLTISASWLPLLLHQAWTDHWSYLTMLGIGALGFLGLYGTHAGLASLQIGLMAMLGWRIPERYQLPLLASGPTDFWRRWNIYLTTWLRVYLFVPTARRLRRWPLPVGVGAGVAVAVTFASIGLLHDVAAGAQTGVLSLHETAGFALFAAVLMCSQAAARARRGRRPGGHPQSRGLGFTLRALQRAVALHLIVFLVAARQLLAG